MLAGTDAPLSEHDTEDEARERLAQYARGAAAAAASTLETGIPRGERVALPDGTEIIVRTVNAEDKALLLAGFEELGDVSRYQRFLSTKKRLSMGELAYFTEVDHAAHEAVGAIDPATGGGVGIARYIRDEAVPDCAEAAVAVADAWQGRGVGGVLLGALAARARDAGITAFTAALLTSNKPMLALFAKLGDAEIHHDEGQVSVLRVPLR
ncbi:MAG: hypothetical protein QOF76_2369 [Solirubrobacteraceae bacterium]|jgi:GNAT superfamily N-acetyltransferase|nr:hypothetical protein [Solirubrobacteraceae bacterium]